MNLNIEQRNHLQQLYDQKHLAVFDAFMADPQKPDFSKRDFIAFLIGKYQEFMECST